MIRHVVLIKTERFLEVEGILRNLLSFVGRVPGLRDVETGRDMTGLAKGYDRGFIMTFDGPEGLAAWDHHPDHIPVRSALMAISEMIVFDYEV